jgi:hypothetical protein
MKILLVLMCLTCQLFCYWILAYFLPNIRDLYRGINEFRRGYQPRNNLVKDENGDLLADSHNILNR